MRYEALEVGQPGNPKCPDQYNEASTLLCPGSKRLVLQVSKQAIRLQFGVMPQGRSLSAGAVQWLNEEPYMPMISSLAREFDAVRVRNYTPGVEAQVMASAA
jgi:hypothetical protein